MERMQTTEQRLGGGRDGTCPAGWVGCDAAVITMMLMKTMSLPLLPAAASFSRAPPLPFAPSCASPLPPLQDESPHPKNSNKFVRVCVCVSVRVCVNLYLCVCLAFFLPPSLPPWMPDLLEEGADAGCGENAVHGLPVVSHCHCRKLN